MTPKGGQPTVRQRFLGLVAEERENQEGKWSIEHDDQHSLETWQHVHALRLSALGETVELANQENPRPGRLARVKQELVKMAAVCLAEYEAIERREIAVWTWGNTERGLVEDGIARQPARYFDIPGLEDGGTATVREAVESMIQEAVGAAAPPKAIRDMTLDEFEALASQAAMEVAAFLTDKHASYGTSNLESFGELGIVVRASDKVQRLRTAYLAGESSSMDGEAVADAWRDLVGYGIMGILYHRENLRG